MKKLSLIFLIGFTTQINAQTSDSLDIKIGQMILVGMPEAKVDLNVLEDVRQGKVGALIYFEKNIPKSASAFAAFKKMSWVYQKAAPIPLFICIDQEGGKVNRLKEKYGFTRSITAASIGKFRSLDSVQFYAEATAATLAGLGINVNFAPCVDLAVNPNNPVIVKAERSYSANADTVALFAKEVVKQHRKFGVVTVLKHFPGHGSSKNDTHLGMADVTDSWTDYELNPYRQLIDSGYVDGIMTSHIVNKKLDRKALPGTLSKAIIDSLLRNKLSYRGVAFSDDMQMKAIASNYGLEEAIKLSINAGVDVLCFSNNIQGVEQRTVDRVHDIIKKFVRTGEISMARINESYQRIMDLKQTMVPPTEQVRQLHVQALKMDEQHRLQTKLAADERMRMEQVLTKKQKRKLYRKPKSK
ncbi:MAG: glycoside hydrolase family 3 protein [Bacteroidetes bacterium]|nr:glycoside hydrolase family 3 protein [Bacteroidota bacterium]